MKENEKTNYVSGKFLTCIFSFGPFKEGENYWLEYVGNDRYVGRSDNILDAVITIEPHQLDYLVEVNEHPLTSFDKKIIEWITSWFYDVRTWGLLGNETNLAFCIRQAVKAYKDFIEKIKIY